MCMHCIYKFVQRWAIPSGRELLMFECNNCGTKHNVWADRFFGGVA